VILDDLRVNENPGNEAPHRLITDCRFGNGTIVSSFTNLYGCTIGDDSRVGPFVEIQRGVTVGPRSKVQSHTFVCEGVRIGDGVFVGHGVTFVNDKHPRATNPDGSLQDSADWELIETVVEDGASIGSGAVILAGVTIGARATVGAGSVVVRDVPADATVAGNPARPTRSGGP
jgi:acetyltransferase-like isoleucine patch superfamily enzyme